MINDNIIKSAAIEATKLMDKWKYTYNLSDEDIIKMLENIVQIKKTQLAKNALLTKQLTEINELDNNEKESNLLEFTRVKE